MNWLVIQTLVFAATLVLVALYTRAAFRQAEGLLKPCLTLTFLEELAKEKEPGGRPFVRRSGGDLILEAIRRAESATVAIRNIGSGPALNVRYEIINAGERAAKKAYDDSLPASPIGPGSFFDTGIPTQKLSKVVVFRAIYESLSGSRYESYGIIRDRRVMSSLRFHRVWWWQRRRLPEFRLPIESEPPQVRSPETPPNA